MLCALNSPGEYNLWSLHVLITTRRRIHVWTRPCPKKKKKSFLNYSQKSKLKNEIESPLFYCHVLHPPSQSVRHSSTFTLDPGHTVHHLYKRNTRTFTGHAGHSGRRGLTWFLRHSKWCDFLHPFRPVLLLLLKVLQLFSSTVLAMVNGYNITFNTPPSSSMVKRMPSSGTWLLKFNSIITNNRHWVTYYLCPWDDDVSLYLLPGRMASSWECYEHLRLTLDHHLKCCNSKKGETVKP